MPTYTFSCQNKKCKTSKFTTVCSISSYNGESTCPTCGTVSKTREYLDDSPSVSIVKDTSDITVGHLANRNRDTMSDDEKTALQLKHTEYLRDREGVDLGEGMERFDKTKHLKQQTKKPKGAKNGKKNNKKGK